LYTLKTELEFKKQQSSVRTTLTLRTFLI